MKRTRTSKILAVAISFAACVYGMVVLTMTPVAGADTLPNGLIVNCNKDSEAHVTCVVSGCPRVGDDYNPDVLHYMVNGGEQQEPSFVCFSGETVRVGVDNNNQPFDLGVQACRKHWPDSDDCSPYATFHYTPPAAPPVQCPPGSEASTVPAGQQCKSAAPVPCPPGSESATVPAGQQCKTAPPKQCPPGSVKAQVPATENCAANTDSIRMDIVRTGINAKVTITNSGGLAGTCAYDAAPAGRSPLPAVHRNVDIAANGTATITDLLWPPLGATYTATVKCTGTYDGKQIQFGQATQDVSGL